MSLKALLTNGNCVNPERTDYYAAIVGSCPSKGARSPKLWNAAFSADQLPAYMWPFDVSENDLPQLIAALKSDAHFIGGAVAVPYKTRIVELLDRVEEEAIEIGAVNAIYRDGGKLVGMNTDGASAVSALEEKLSTSLAGKRVVLAGTGGAGKAVAVYVAHKLGSKGQLVLANRTPAGAEALAARLSSMTRTAWVPYSDLARSLNGADVFVNCTSIGMELWRSNPTGVEYFRPYTPLGPIPDVAPTTVKDRKEYLAHFCDAIAENHRKSMRAISNSSLSLVYDIVYQPTRTMLLELASCAGMETLNGEQMNLRQAALAYRKAASATGLTSIELRAVEKNMMNAFVSL